MPEDISWSDFCAAVERAGGFPHSPLERTEQQAVQKQPPRFSDPIDPLESAWEDEVFLGDLDNHEWPGWCIGAAVLSLLTPLAVVTLALWGIVDFDPTDGRPPEADYPMAMVMTALLMALCIPLLAVVRGTIRWKRHQRDSMQSVP